MVGLWEKTLFISIKIKENEKPVNPLEHFNCAKSEISETQISSF